LTPFYKNCLEKTIVIDNNKKVGINNIDIEIINLTNSYGFKFISGRFTLGYIPDTIFTTEIGEYYQDSDILIINVLDPRNLKRENHLSSEDAEKIIMTAKPQLAIITGFGVKMLQSEPLYQAREIQKTTGIQVVAAKDGMTINPVSFATTVRQKNLKGF
jgi:phosphoribosyl 1,2-cyclic phosphodiesterase